MDFFSEVMLPDPGTETSETLHESEMFTIERIASNHFVNGTWYDQEHDEWVMLVRGTAVMEFKDGTVSKMRSGEYMMLKKHVLHRVLQTSEDALWLAVHGVVN